MQIARFDLSNCMISICLPTLNARRFLPERMESILAQTRADWELIVCDSYSDDGTWEYLKQFESDPRVRLFQVPKEGLYAGWNECLKRVRGEFIYIATADDTMDFQCLHKLLEPMLMDSNVSLVKGKIDQIDESGKIMLTESKQIHVFLQPFLKAEKTEISGLSLFLLLAAFGWGLGSVTGFMFRKEVLHSAGFFPTDLGFLGDAEWTLRAVLSVGKVVWLSDTVATWRFHPFQASRRKNRLLEAWFFREALRRVLDAPGTLPLSRLRLEVLQARETELEVATLLHRSNLSTAWRKWPWFIIQALKIEPKLVWKRVMAGFGSPKHWRMTAPEQARSLLNALHAPWPPKTFHPAPALDK